jgi:predicted ATPase
MPRNAMKLSEERFKRFVNNWNFSYVHLMYEWEDLTRVSEDIKTVSKDYVEKFTLDRQELFIRFKGGEPPGLYIYSEVTGNGKTTTIHQIAKDLILANKMIQTMRYDTGNEIFVELTKTFGGRTGEDESEILDKMTTCDVYFLDDLDKIGKLSEYQEKRLNLIIDKRYTNLRPIIITANKSLDQMKMDKQINRSLYSRLTQMCKEIQLIGDDFRLKDKEKIKERKFL